MKEAAAQQVHRQAIPAFERLGQRFGPYTQTVVIDEGHVNFYLTAPPEASRSKHGHIHPHAENEDTQGEWGVCWYPSYQHTVVLRSLAIDGEIDLLLYSTRELARDGIRELDPDAYCQVERWCSHTATGA